MNTLDFGFWFLIPSKMCFRLFMDKRPCKCCFAIFGSLTCSSWNKLRLTRNRWQAGGGCKVVRIMCTSASWNWSTPPDTLSTISKCHCWWTKSIYIINHLTKWMRFNPLPTGKDYGFQFINLGFPKKSIGRWDQFDWIILFEGCLVSTNQPSNLSVTWTKWIPGYSIRTNYILWYAV